MRSIKPGRGPSFMGGIGSIFAAIFGIIWTFGAASMGAPGFFVLFGVVFVVLGIVNSVYNIKNATSEKRYSVFDITDDKEEPDPLNEMFGRKEVEVKSEGANFCPFCGFDTEPDHVFCKQCGKKIN